MLIRIVSHDINYGDMAEIEINGVLYKYELKGQPSRGTPFKYFPHAEQIVQRLNKMIKVSPGKAIKYLEDNWGPAKEKVGRVASVDEEGIKSSGNRGSLYDLVSALETKFKVSLGVEEVLKAHERIKDFGSFIGGLIQDLGGLGKVHCIGAYSREGKPFSVCLFVESSKVTKNELKTLLRSPNEEHQVLVELGRGGYLVIVEFETIKLFLNESFKMLSELTLKTRMTVPEFLGKLMEKSNLDKGLWGLV